MTRIANQRGFSFLEVLLAMAILLLGSVAILSLFTLGVNDLIQRRVDGKLEQVRTEVLTILQDAVDKKPFGQTPAPIPEKADDPPMPLSLRDYGIRVSFKQSDLAPTSLIAHTVLHYQGRPVKVLPPIPLVRSTIDPR